MTSPAEFTFVTLSAVGQSDWGTWLFQASQTPAYVTFLPASPVQVPIHAAGQAVHGAEGSNPATLTLRKT